MKGITNVDFIRKNVRIIFFKVFNLLVKGDAFGNAKDQYF